jgi:glycosyltransferase involved in cell wall biosynthesis
MVDFIDNTSNETEPRRRTQLHGVIAVIPAYNAENTIAKVVAKSFRKAPRCVVVDDGSTDNTGDEAKKAGAEVIVHVHNRGKGAAIRSAIECLKDEDFLYMVFLDADEQHEPGEMGRLIHAARRRHADVVCGNRMNNPKDMPRLRVKVNRLTSRITSRLCGTHIQDTQCGFRLISKNVAQTISITSQRFDVDSELLFLAAQHGFNITDASVSCIYAENYSSHIHPFRDTMRFIRLALSLSIRRLLLFGRFGKVPKKKES